MNGQKIHATDPIRLSFKSEQQVYVESEDDRFCITEREAAFACRMLDQHKVWQKEFPEFLAAIKDWSAKYPNQVENAFVGVGEGFLHMIFVTKMEDFDLEFNDRIIDFDDELRNRYDWLKTNIKQIAGHRRKSLAYFKNLVMVYGDTTGTLESGRLE